jgi:hypothetical protein
MTATALHNPNRVRLVHGNAVPYSKEYFTNIIESMTESALTAPGQPARPVVPAHLSFLAAPGDMPGLIAAHDWSATPLGPLDAWPQSLRTTVSLMLNSSHPIWIGWGPQATFLYNDAYVDVLSRAKHPWALGLPAAQVWAEIWDFCGPLADKSSAGGSHVRRQRAVVHEPRKLP